jgi:hypothetical protein
LLVVTERHKSGVFRVGCSAASVLKCIACVECAFSEGSSTFAGHRNLVAIDLLGKPLKSFIVNPADLPGKGVKRLATSDERLNHGSR